MRNPCGVDEKEWYSIDIYHFLNSIASGAGKGRHDRPVLAQQAVEQARFAHVGSPHENSSHSLPIDYAGIGFGEEAFHVLYSLCDWLLRILCFDFVLGEVDPSCEICEDVKQLVS